MVSCCRLLGVRSFVPEVRSPAGHSVPLNLHQNKCYLCSDEKEQGPKAQPSPSEVHVLAKRGSLRGPVPLPGSVHPAPRLRPPASAQALLKRQLSAGGALRARSPGPAQPSSLREPGPRSIPPSGFSGRPNGRGESGGPGVADPCRLLPPPSGRRAGDAERFAAASSPGPNTGLGQGSRALPDTGCPWAPSPPTGPRPEGLEGPGEKAPYASHYTLRPRTAATLTLGGAQPLTAQIQVSRQRFQAEGLSRVNGLELRVCLALSVSS